MENWKDLYLELAALIKNGIEAVKWVDLWHNQVGFLAEEHPIPVPAVFITMRSLDMEDLSDNIQNVNTQIDVYLFYETFLDTFQGAYNQAGAVSFLDTLTDIQKLLHGTSGTNFSEMRRVSFTPVDTGSAQNLYRQSFVCLVTDCAAKSTSTEIDENTELDLEAGSIVVEDPNNELFNIN